MARDQDRQFFSSYRDTAFYFLNSRRRKLVGARGRAPPLSVAGTSIETVALPDLGGPLMPTRTNHPGTARIAGPVLAGRPPLARLGRVRAVGPCAALDLAGEPGRPPPGLPHVGDARHPDEPVAGGVLTFGESWYNHHHAFPTSARHGLLRWELDATFRTIRLMPLVGLVKGVKLRRFAPTALPDSPAGLMS